MYKNFKTLFMPMADRCTSESKRGKVPLSPSDSNMAKERAEAELARIMPNAGQVTEGNVSVANCRPDAL